ncbi:MAG: cysteine hydrolase family protein [Nitrosotalea sp.]
MKLSLNTALILIDVQKGFDEASFWGKRNNLSAEENMAKLLATWRRTKRPILYIKHNSRNPKVPLHPKHKGNEIKDIVKPENDEPIIIKSVNSAFIGTDLEKRLREQGIDTIVIVGLTTDHCVSTTTRMAGNLGFTTYLVSDATATFDRKGPTGKYYTADEMHDLALASLHNEFATVVTTEKLLNHLA